MKSIFYIASLLCFVIVYGQPKAGIVGEPYDVNRSENFSGFIGESKTAVFTLDYNYINRNKQELVIRKFYKNDLKEIEARDIYTSDKDDYVSDPQEVFYQDEKFYLFSIYDSDRSDVNLLRLEILDINLQREADLIIDTLTQEDDLLIEEEIEGKGFAIAVFNKLAKLRDREVRLITVDNSGGVGIKQAIKSPISLQGFVVEQMTYKKGIPIYLLCNFSVSATTSIVNEQERLINNNYSLWAFDPEENFLKEFELRFSVKWIHGIKLMLNSKNNLYITGFVNETRNRAVNGVFSLLLDDRFNVITSHYNKFEDEVINQFLTDKEVGKIREIEDVDMRDAFLLEDNSCLLFAEEYLKYTERNYDPRTNITTTIDHFYYHSIIISYLNENGNLVWIKRVPKMQNTTNDFGYYSSFCVFNAGDKALLYFNDNQKNIGQPTENSSMIEDLNENRRSIITGLVVNKDSIGTRFQVLNDEFSFGLRAKKINQISKETGYLYTENRRSGRLVAIPLR